MKRFFPVIFSTLMLLCIVIPISVGAKGVVWASGTSSLDFIDDASMSLEKRVKSSDDKFLRNLYSDLFYTPVWVDEKGLTGFGNELISVVATDKTLLSSMQSAKLYTKLNEKLKIFQETKGGTLKDKVDLELEFSNLYQAYADYMIYGGINWSSFKSKLASLKRSKDIDAGWEVYKPRTSPKTVLLNAVVGGDLKGELKKAQPKRFKYAKLQEYLIKYINIADKKSWKDLPKYSKKIKPSKSDKAIPMIRNNLALEGDLGPCRDDMGSLVYDECLLKAVKRFQLRNGLKADGVIGKGTYAILNISIGKKIKLIRLNLDRIKRLRHKKSQVHMELNIPSFRLQFYDGAHLVDTMRVVVGKRKNPTPSFGDIIQYIVVNPWWKIPESIVKKEMLGKLIKDPYYYERKGKVLRATWSETSQRIDPGTINWSKYKGKGVGIPYRFMQVPSRNNALGKIKFIFPNKFSVYIHDTPSKKLFFRTDRAFSHGCMRIQKPRDLLKAFAMFNDNIDVEAVMKRLQGTDKRTINLKTRVPIDITYLTAFVDDYGNMNFRKDVYGYDKYMLKDYDFKIDKYVSKDRKKSKNKKKKKEKKEKKIEKKESKKKAKSDGYEIREVYPPEG